MLSKPQNVTLYGKQLKRVEIKNYYFCLRNNILSSDMK